MSDDWHYTIRVDPRGWPDPDVGPDGPMTCEEALAQQSGPDPHSMWRTIALRAAGGSAEAAAETEWAVRWDDEDGGIGGLGHDGAVNVARIYGYGTPESKVSVVHRTVTYGPWTEER